jgi:hypothetical protein
MERRLLAYSFDKEKPGLVAGRQTINVLYRVAGRLTRRARRARNLCREAKNSIY